MPRYDLLIQSDSEGFEPALITTNSEEDPVVLGCAGLYALAGQVLRLLLTPRGSWPARKSEGSELADVAGSIFDKISFDAVVARSLISVEETIKTNQLSLAVPPDEKLHSLEVLSTEVLSEGSAVVRILIRSVSGSQVVLTTGTN